MDHLLCPQDGVPLDFKVLVQDSCQLGTTIFDGGQFMTIPEWRDSGTRLSPNGRDRALAAEELSDHSTLETLAFVQAW